MKQFLLVVLFSFAVFSFTVGAQAEIKEITFASENWVQATEKDGSGLYWDIFRAVYEPLGIRVNTITKSYNASVNMVQTQRVDAMVGAYADEIEKGIYPEHHFAVDEVEVLGKKETMVSWEGQKTLENKKVGWIKGYSYDEYLDVKVIKKTFENRGTAFRVLDKGRIDYLMDAKADLADHFKAGKADPEKYTTRAVLELKLFTVFADNEKGQKLAEIFDRRFAELLKSGEIMKLYNHYIAEQLGTFSNPF